MNMSAEPVWTEDQTTHLHELAQRFGELGSSAASAQWARMFAALEPILHNQRAFTDALASPEFQEATRRVLESFAAADLSALRAVGPARKVSVSMPEDLTVAVQQRVGRGKFSQYVTEAVTRQLELDLLDELSELLTAEQGPVPEEYLAEAHAAWPVSE
jgi:Arc/MetJ-type ribon-helix-helix transcriptional regulator